MRPGVEHPHLVLWTCLCSQTAPEREDLPERCPGHDRTTAVLIRCERKGLTAIGHDCPDFRLCPKEDQ